MALSHKADIKAVPDNTRFQGKADFILSVTAGIQTTR